MDFIGGVNTDIQGTIQVCAIIDCYCDGPEAGHQIYEKLVEAIKSKDDELPVRKFHFEFINKENKARFTLFGDPDYITRAFQLL